MSSTPQPSGAMPASPNPLLAGPFIDTMNLPISPKAVTLVAPITTLYVLALTCIALRFWSRKIKKVGFFLSDAYTLVAALFATGFLAICWLVVKRGGVGFPLRQVPPPQRLFTQQSFIVAWLIQGWANSFVRLSILSFLAATFAKGHKHFKWVIRGFEAATVAYLIGCTITFFAICRPFKYNWIPGPGILEHCGNLEMKFLLSAIFNLVLDVTILVLPLPLLWNLQLNIHKKVALTFVFGLGIFVCFATAWRVYHVNKFSTPEAKLNFTITIVEDALWSGLEIMLGIINACLPVIPPALSKIFNAPLFRLVSFSSLFSSRSKSSKGSSPSTGNSKGSQAPLAPTGRSWLVGRSNASQSSQSSSINDDKMVYTQQYSIDVESEAADSSRPQNLGYEANVKTPGTPRQIVLYY